jgi:L-amino acid N-acyltransferase YncA
LPSVALVLADNQRLAARNLEKAGASLTAESPDEIPVLVERLADDEPLRLSMIAAAAAVTDGNGARRVAKAMIGPSPKLLNELSFRPARADDSRTVWVWRNDHMTRTFSQTTTPVPWPDHKAWWDKAVTSADRQFLIAEAGGVPVAALRFDKVEDDHEFEVSINLAPSARGSGLGGRVLAEACRSFRQDNPTADLVATIHEQNPASRRIFEKIGFRRVGALSKPPFERYVLHEGMGK